MSQLILYLLIKYFILICVSGSSVSDTDSDVLEFNWEPISTSSSSSSSSIKQEPSVSRNNRRFITNKTPYIYQNKVETNNDNDDMLESEFGTWSSPNTEDNLHTIKRKRRPKFQTYNSSNTNRYHEFDTDNNSNNNNNKWKFIQKIPKVQEPVSNTRKRINAILKNYLAKLYTQKYMSSPTPPPPPPSNHKRFYNDHDQESKFLDGGLWGFKNKTLKFAKKFLSLFTVVQFDNFACQATSANIQYMGICYTQAECDNLNGTAIGNCASGFGVCCVFRNTCGGSSSQNCTYFENPGYPNYDPPGDMTTAPPPATTQNPSPTPDPRVRYYNNWGRQSDYSLSCIYTVYKTNPNVQQMRIDFLDLELTGPTNGTCRDERLIISGQNLNNPIPVICGYNSGQHVYVDVSMLSGPLQLSVLSTTMQRKRFRIRICQIAMSCTNSNNCLQYYTGLTGTISSFNYDQAAILSRSTPGYFNNLNYAICIRKEAGFCSITYTNMPAGLEYPFQFRNLDETGMNIVPPGQAGVEIFNCPDDYIVIGGTRLCGDKFNDGTVIEDFAQNAPVTDSSAGPIVVQVRTNEMVTGRGFKLFYTQNRCPNNM